MARLSLSTELKNIPIIGVKFIAKLQKLNLKTINDLLWHFPFRYEDYSKIVPIGELQIDQSATIQGIINQISTRRTWKKNLLITEAIIVDETGGIKAVWFNQPYVTNILKEKHYYNFAGKATRSKREVYLASPSYEPIDSYQKGEAKHTAGLIPIYPETRGLTSKGLRYLIKPILKELGTLSDPIPEEILKEQHLPNLNLAFKHIHFPLQASDAETAKKRFAFENLFYLQLNNFKTKMRLAEKKSAAFQIQKKEIIRIMRYLPFQLTQSQESSLQEIIADLQKSHPMNRLLQGDVGSGKTIVAAISAILTAENNLQTVFMAPTEVLANQHYGTLLKTFPNFLGGIALLTANKTDFSYGKLQNNKISKPRLLEEIAEGRIKIIIGTHAVLQKNVKFKNLGLAIVDEQHRFGVAQRAQLLHAKSNSADPTTEELPNFLSMSATPIPRTLSLTIFGDLDLSAITELPAGRKKIITKIVAPENRGKAYDFIREQIKKGRQAFVICPRIEPPQARTNSNDALTNAENQSPRGSTSSKHKSALLWETKAVKEEFEKLSKKIFPELKIAMLHGKMDGKEKNEIMKNFQDRNYDILISTSVIEVGVDIPNAAIMIIEGADRFGLAQLYQFRGRVGRGEHQSFCLLFADSNSDNVQKRLNYLLTAENGFELAEKDLQLRGSGQFLGENQTGLPDVAMDALQNILLVKASRDAAGKILSDDPQLSKYPALAAKFVEFQKTIHLE